MFCCGLFLRKYNNQKMKQNLLNGELKGVMGMDLGKTFNAQLMLQKTHRDN